MSASGRRWRTGHEHQVRQVDQAHGSEARPSSTRSKSVLLSLPMVGTSSRTACRRTATTSASATTSKSSTDVFGSIVDPKNFDSRAFVDMRVPDGERCMIPPNSFALAQSVERFKIPRNVLTLCIGKSTFARCGIIVNVTPFEPEWEGVVTLEISNTTPLPAAIYAGEGLAQVLFFESDEDCETSYKDRNGKYLSRVRPV